jgi:hypothetical protein
MEANLLVQDAIDRLTQHTGIEAVWEEAHRPGIDGAIILRYHNRRYTFHAEVRKQIREPQLYALLQLKKAHRHLMVIAEHIFPKIKTQLRQQDIGYLETNGNIYAKQKELLLWIDGFKPIAPVNEKTGRAFTKTGLKLVFHFLLHEDWVNLPYREIANRTGVGFGNINFVMTDLKAKGFLLPANDRELTMVRQKELTQQWATAYKDKLQPALFIGRFRFLHDEEDLAWKKTPLDAHTLWGGEAAADLLTGYLHPDILAFYTTETKTALMKKYRLLPDPTGRVVAYKRFWQGPDTQTVPPLLVYIDLLNNADRRSLEAAQKIKNGFLPRTF